MNADDFGFTAGVNAGIVEAHRNGILTSTTLMANGAAFDDAVRLARENPSLDVGCHLVLIGGQSLLDGAPLASSVMDLVRAVYAGTVNIYDELAAQVRRILAAGIQPTHLDTHKHTHLLPPVLRAVCTLAEEFDIRWVRKPADLDLPFRASAKVKLLSRLLRLREPGVRRTLEACGCRTTDHFAGFSLTGTFDARDLEKLFAQLPDGSTELMCHPGLCDQELRGAATRLKESRAAELAALTDARTRSALERAGIALTSFSSL